MTAVDRDRKLCLGLSGAAGAVAVASVVVALRSTAPLYADTALGMGVACALWLFFAGIMGVLSVKKISGPAVGTEAGLFLAVAAGLAAAIPLLAVWAAGAAAETILVSAAAVAPAGLACGLLLAKTWISWSRLGQPGESYAAGAVGAIAGGGVSVLLFMAWPVVPSAAGEGYLVLQDAVTWLSRPEFSEWFMPGAGLVAAILAVAFGGGKGSGRAVGASVFAAGAMLGALTLGLMLDCAGYGPAVYGMAACILAALTGGLAAGMWLTAWIKVPALWVLTPLHGGLCFVTGAALPVSERLASDDLALLAGIIFSLASAAAGTAGGLHFGLASRQMTGGLVPDERAAGLFGLAVAGAIVAILAAALILFPAFGPVRSVKAVSLVCAGAMAALLMALNRR